MDRADTGVKFFGLAMLYIIRWHKKHDLDYDGVDKHFFDYLFDNIESIEGADVNQQLQQLDVALSEFYNDM